MPVIQRGYDQDFLLETLKLPKIPISSCAPLIKGKGHEIKYVHYSCFLDKNWRLPLLTICNIRGEGYNANSRVEGEPWQVSDQVHSKYQLTNDFYGNDRNVFDRGHMVRRVDPCWGHEEVANTAELETFRWVNCTPQHKKLNRDGGIWYQLEQHVMEKGVKNKIADITVLSGPVLSEDDKYFIPDKGPLKGKYIKIPTEFWKMIVWRKQDGKLYAVAFLMSQWSFIKDKVVPLEKALSVHSTAKKSTKKSLRDDYFETLKFSDFQTYQVPVSIIEKKTGIKFDWPNVNFPYKGKRAVAIQSLPVKKVVPFAEIQSKSKRMRATLLRDINIASVNKAVLTEQNGLSDFQVKRAIKKGYGASLKRFQLLNVKL